jgi:hypothetical protein
MIDSKDKTTALEASKAHLLTEGWCVIPDVLSPGEAAETLTHLWESAAEYERQGGETHIQGLDPNDSNVRVFNLPGLHPVFRDLLRHPLALDLVHTLLGSDIIASNFSANIARPGARAMRLHSDQSLVVAEPWVEPWAINIIWCLTDATFENGSTQFVPGSHKVTRLTELGDKPGARLQAFEAKAGSIVAMDGRIWHTSGNNITADQDRALLFGYYTSGFLRPQVNWNGALPLELQQQLDPELKQLLGLAGYANMALAGKIMSLDLGKI